MRIQLPLPDGVLPAEIIGHGASNLIWLRLETRARVYVTDDGIDIK